MKDKCPEKMYIHKNELEYSAFIPIPIELIKEEEFRSVSIPAKLLYGFLLSRTYISNKNEMLDENGRVFVYMTLEEVRETLNVSLSEAKNLFRELTNVGGSGIGLIKKERIYGKPSQIFLFKLNEVRKMLNKGK